MTTPDPKSPLLGQHYYAMLVEGSAIAPALVSQRGYQSLWDPEHIFVCGFTKAQAKTAPALGIPLWDVHGQRHGWQIRPDAPRQLGNGKVCKYEVPQGDRLILDVHPAVQPLIGDPAVPLWITEGVKKGDALATQGLCTIALIGGVWGFKGSNEHGGKTILPDWQHVALNGRQVNVVFDSDLATKPQVHKALKALYDFLCSKAAIPVLLHWPTAFQTRKWGVDDFFATGHTLAELQAMLPQPGPLPSRPPSADAGPVTLDKTREGTARPALLNILFVLEQDPAWAGVLGFNQLLNDVVFLARPPYLPDEGTLDHPCRHRARLRRNRKLAAAHLSTLCE